MKLREKYRFEDMYKICERCIMDTTDREIYFDNDGNCNHCTRWFDLSNKIRSSNNEEKLVQMAKKIKRTSKKKYDCLIGVSGGVDSTYTALKVKELGLKPLAVHMDNGWNTELSVDNIRNTLEILDIDLITHVLDWDEFKNLQLAFLRASTPDSEIPTDHAISAVINKIAIKEKIKWHFSGYNHANEGIMPRTWSQGHNDWRYIKTINRKFGTEKLKTFPHKSFLFNIYIKRINKIHKIYPLNFIEYNKNEAINIIKSELKWRPYGGKHYESIYTRFFQGYILPRKFGIDKRRAHLSTLICNNEISRDEGIIKMEENSYPSNELMQEDLEFVLKKLGLNNEEFDEIMQLEKLEFDDYPSYYNSKFVNLLLKMTKSIR